MLASCVLQLKAQNMIELWGDTHWTDGTASYHTFVFEGDVSFVGGTCHEGGYAFCLATRNAAKGEYTLQPYSDPSQDGPSDYVPLNGRIGSQVTRRTVAGKEYLVVKDGNRVTDILERYDGNLHKRLEDDIRTQYCGIYCDNYGQEMIITPEKMMLSDICEYSQYEIMEEYETPSNVFHLTHGNPAWPEYIRIQLNESGITLYQVTRNEYDDYENQVELRSAQLLWNDCEDVVSRWPFTAKQVLTTGILSPYPKKLLRLMRNEIMARHGYCFKSEDLAEYFDREPWYAPMNPDNKVVLNPIEALNVELIKGLETQDNRYTDEMPDTRRWDDMREHFAVGCPGGAWGYSLRGKVNNEDVELYLSQSDDTKVVTGWAVHPARRDTVLLIGNVDYIRTTEYNEDGTPDGYLTNHTFSVEEISYDGTVHSHYAWSGIGTTYPEVIWDVNGQNGTSDLLMEDFSFDHRWSQYQEANGEWQAGEYAFIDKAYGDTQTGSLQLSHNPDGSIHYRLFAQYDDLKGARVGDFWPQFDRVRINLGLGHSIALQNFGRYIMIYNQSLWTNASPYTFGNRVQPVGCYMKVK